MEFKEMRMHLPKKIFALSLFLLVSVTAFAQKIILEGSVQPVVAKGNVFKVEYTVNARPERFIGPDFGSLEVLAGPSESYGWSTYISGGTMQRAEQFVFTYVLMAGEPGIYSLPSAKVVVEGKEYASAAVPFEVIEGNQQSPSAQPGNQGGGRQQQRQTSLTSEDIFIRAIVDKTNVYKGQPVRVTYKLYSRYPVVGSDGHKAPAYNGFWKKELQTGQQQYKQEAYNSQVYPYVIVFQEDLLYTTQAGTLQIDPMEMNVYVQIVTQAQPRSMLDVIVGGGPDIKQVNRRVSTSPVTIRVNDLPVGAPASFNGAVGNFTMTSEFPEGTVGVNSSVNYIIRISGVGNFDNIQAPRLEVPGTFEQYNVTNTDNISVTAGGLSGFRQFEYPLIARAEGDYIIDPVEFTYFDPAASRYVTLSTPERHISVAPDSTGSRSTTGGTIISGTREEIKILGQDIRFIKLGAPGLSLNESIFMGSIWYFLILGLIIAVFVFMLFYLQKRIREMRNVEIVRGKRANKVALQRLKAAEKYMKEDNQRNFYEEMLKALWGYMGDKLNIPSSSLTKENVREELLKRGIPAEQVARYTDLISDCEYAQYSPSGSGHMQDIYSSAVNAISKFESTIKR